MKKLTFLNYLPGLLCIFFAILLLSLMTIPYSQYDFLSKMAALNEANMNQGETLSVSIAIPGLMIIFNILWIVVIALLSLVTLAVSDIYHMKQIHNFILPMPFLIAFNSILYFAIGNQVVIDGITIVTWLNFIPTVFAIVFSGIYGWLWCRFVRRPFVEFKREVMDGTYEFPSSEVENSSEN